MSNLLESTSQLIRSIYGTAEIIGLHEPRFNGREKDYLADCIDSTFVSSIGKYVDKFEDEICKISGAKYAIAAVNGTNALHIALLVCGVQSDDLVITQSLSFVATCNAISYLGARPLFIDIDKRTLGLSSESLREFLDTNVEIKDDGFAYHKKLGNRISACVPMHSFGFPCEIDAIVELCSSYGIAVVEDAAEAMGSTYKGRAVGTFGKCGVYSFNGNKIITSGGGGVIITNDKIIAEKAKHLTTVAKISHPWKFEHDEIGYNFRMPNVNAALACAQLEQLDEYIIAKRALSVKYQQFFGDYSDVQYVVEPVDTKSNYWLNSILFSGESDRDDFLAFTNEKGLMTRPTWDLLSNLKMYKDCYAGNLSNSEWISKRLVSLPSSVPIDLNIES